MVKKLVSGFLAFINIVPYAIAGDTIELEKVKKSIYFHCTICII